ncbi:MAG: type II toxin-antitoxin system prevent-host-death family antitoxin [Planctomycetota bacterium]
MPVSEFKAKAAEWLQRIQRGETVVITQNGKAAGVVVSPLAYDELMEKIRFVQAVEQGLADVAAGRTVPHDKVVAEMRQRFGGAGK